MKCGNCEKNIEAAGMYMHRGDTACTIRASVLNEQHKGWQDTGVRMDRRYSERYAERLTKNFVEFHRVPSEYTESHNSRYNHVTPHFFVNASDMAVARKIAVACKVQQYNNILEEK